MSSGPDASSSARRMFAMRFREKPFDGFVPERADHEGTQVNT